MFKRNNTPVLYVRPGFCFAIPMNKFTRMVDDMEESFIITPSWAKVQKRIARSRS
jgi:hypothetical protein